jgi:hypothetical protein
MGRVVDDHPGIVTDAGTVESEPHYAYTSIDYGPLHEMDGVRLIESGTPSLTMNVHFDRYIPIRSVEATVTVGDSG